MLMTDAYGSNGGIAKFNRDLISALNELNRNIRLIVWPRKCVSRKFIPDMHNVDYQPSFTSSALAYSINLLLFSVQQIVRRVKLNAIFCCHINFLILATVLSVLTRSKLILIIHGVDAWEERSFWINRCLKRVTHVLSVSDFTKERFVSWSKLDQNKITVFPNCVEISKYYVDKKPENLMEKYALKDRFVVMTLGRLSSKERYKGIDELIELAPKLSLKIPNLTYLIVGNGDDLDRLKTKAVSLKIKDKVIFTGFIEESEKSDYYRLADVFAMPGYGEGFGIVYLEAMACGIPVIASTKDGSREAVLHGELGAVVNPSNSDEIENAILKIYKNPIRKIPEKLSYYDYSKFKIRLKKIIDQEVL